MVAKATQNLFDVNIGGAGFHVTSHLIALAALFIACFAIAGYVSFRDDSVPASALKEQSDSLTKQGETWTFEKEFDTGTLVHAENDIITKTGLVLPADAVVVNSTAVTTSVCGAITSAIGGATFDLVLADRNGTVGSAPTGLVQARLIDGITETNLLNRGLSSGNFGNPVLSAVEEVYLILQDSAISVVASPGNAKLVLTVSWIGSAPVAY